MAGGPDRRCHFEVSPPRHFLYPSLLLLLAEEPRHGYRLVDSLLRLGLGPIDRPSVYRALAALEGDGLLHSWEAMPDAGATRQVYGVTPAGHVMLARWMAVVGDERDAFEMVLKRYDNLTDDETESEPARRIDPSVAPQDSGGGTARSTAPP